jgi:uncharacterized membrane protein
MLHAERHQINHALTQKDHELQDMKQNFLADLQNRVTKVVALQALLAESNEKYEALVRQHSGEEHLKLKITSLEAHIHQAQAVHQKVLRVLIQISHFVRSITYLDFDRFRQSTAR